MTYKLSDVEFAELEKRVANGKKYLEGKWGARDRETRDYVDLWFELSRLCIDQMILRGMFSNGYDHEALKASAEAKIQRNAERMKQYMHTKTKGGARKKPIESPTLSLF